MKIILVGKGGSGKDYLKKFLVNKGYTPSISYTTRPIRDTEIQGEDYYYISEEEFQEKIREGFFEEYTCFNNWWYGTSKESFLFCDVFVMTPNIVSSLRKEIKEDSLVIYIDVPMELRKERLGMRNIIGTHDIVERRIERDEEDFKGFSDFDIRIKSGFFSPEKVEKIIKAYNGEN